MRDTCGVGRRGAPRCWGGKEGQGSHCAGAECRGCKEVLGREGDRRTASRRWAGGDNREQSPSRPPGLYSAGSAVQRWKQACTPVNPPPTPQCARPASPPIHNCRTVWSAIWEVPSPPRDTQLGSEDVRIQPTPPQGADPWAPLTCQIIWSPYPTPAPNCTPGSAVLC